MTHYTLQNAITARPGLAGCLPRQPAETVKTPLSAYTDFLGGGIRAACPSPSIGNQGVHVAYSARQN